MAGAVAVANPIAYLAAFVTDMDTALAPGRTGNRTLPLRRHAVTRTQLPVASCSATTDSGSLNLGFS